MAEAQIRYCTTEDGARIACRVQGSGDPLIVASSFISITFGLLDARTRLYEALARQFRLVTYDGRGMGLSDRAGADYSLDERMADLKGVANALGIERFRLLGQLYGSPVAIAFAASYPERIERLVLLQAYSDGDQFYERSDFGRVAQALRDLTVDQWEFVSRATIVRGAMPGTPADVLEQRAAAMREAWTPEALLAFRDANRRINVIHHLASVRAPTLVVHTTDRPDSTVTLENARAIVSAIPDARLLNSDVKWDEFPPDTVNEILAFLGATGRRRRSRPGDESGVRTVLFTDIVGHTEMMQRLGDAKGRAVLREHERITRDLLKQHGGAEVKTMGDGFMASFGSVTSAMECAIALQRAFEAWNDARADSGEGGAEAPQLRVRVGLNAGEPIEEDGDLFGATVILASRIAAKADGGEILVPDTVRGLLSGKGFMFSDRGEFVPKGFDEGVRLWDVRWRE